MDSTEGGPDCSSVSAAARVGDSESLQQLIVNGSCIDVQDSRGWTALHEAAKANHCDCVKILLQHIEDEKDVNVVTLEEETALLFAAQNGNKEMIEQLLQHGADLNIFDIREICPLLAAVEGNHRECVELLLKNGACLNCTDRNGFSSLHKAAYSDLVDMVQFLLESGAKIDVHCYHESTPMYAAALNGYLDCLKLLVEHGADINITTDDATPLYTAAKENHPDCVKYLLKQGASITISRPVDSTDDESVELAPIHIAAVKGHMRCLRLLIPVSLGLLEDDYIDFYKELQTPMHLAAKKGHVKVIKALLKAGCDPDFGLVDFPKYYRKKLRAAQPVTLVAMHNLEFGVAKLLLDKAAFVCNAEGLHCHCLVKESAGHLPSLKFILEYGADVGCHHMNRVKLPKSLECVILLLKSGKRWSFDCSDQCGFCYRYLSPCYWRDRTWWLKIIKLVYNYVDRLRLCQHTTRYIQDHSELSEVLELTGKPHSLEHLCRVAFTEHVGTVRATKIIPKMDFLPKLVRDYLLYEDVTLPSTEGD